MNTWNKRSKIKKKQTEDSLQYDLLTGFSSNTVLDFVEGGTNNNFKKIGWYKFKFVLSYLRYPILITLISTIYWVLLWILYYRWVDGIKGWVDLFIPGIYTLLIIYPLYKIIVEIPTWVNQTKYFKFWLLASASGYKIPHNKLKPAYKEYSSSGVIHNFYKYDGTVLPKMETIFRYSKFDNGKIKLNYSNNQIFSYDGSSSWYVQKYKFNNNLKWSKSAKSLMQIRSLKMRNARPPRWKYHHRRGILYMAAFVEYLHYYANTSIFSDFLIPNIFWNEKKYEKNAERLDGTTYLFSGIISLFKRLIGVSKLPKELKLYKQNKINRYHLNWTRRDSIEINELLTNYQDIKLPDSTYFDKVKLTYSELLDTDGQFFNEYAQLPEMYLFDFGSFSKHLAKQKFEAKELKQIEQFINDNLNNKNISFLEKSYMVYWLNTFTNNNLESKTKDYDSNIFSSQSKDRLGNTIKHGIYTIINNLDLYEKEGNLYQKKMDKKIKQLLKDKMSYADIWLQL